MRQGLDDGVRAIVCSSGLVFGKNGGSWCLWRGEVLEKNVSLGIFCLLVLHWAVGRKETTPASFINGHWIRSVKIDALQLAMPAILAGPHRGRGSRKGIFLAFRRSFSMIAVIEFMTAIVIRVVMTTTPPSLFAADNDTVRGWHGSRLLLLV